MRMSIVLKDAFSFHGFTSKMNQGLSLSIGRPFFGDEP